MMRATVVHNLSAIGTALPEAGLIEGPREIQHVYVLETDADYSPDLATDLVNRVMKLVKADAEG